MAFNWYFVFYFIFHFAHRPLSKSHCNAISFLVSDLSKINSRPFNERAHLARRKVLKASGVGDNGQLIRRFPVPLFTGEHVGGVTRWEKESRKREIEPIRRKTRSKRGRPPGALAKERENFAVTRLGSLNRVLNGECIKKSLCANRLPTTSANWSLNLI